MWFNETAVSVYKLNVLFGSVSGNVQQGVDMIFKQGVFEDGWLWLREPKLKVMNGIMHLMPVKGVRLG